MDRKTANNLRRNTQPRAAEGRRAILRCFAPSAFVVVAEGREPLRFHGANIGTRQKYIRIYTEPLIRYLSCEGTDA